MKKPMPVYMRDSEKKTAQPLEKSKAFGTDLQDAEDKLKRYEAKIPRILEGLKNSPSKASAKKKLEAKVNRMHKYFKDGVAYAKAVEETKNNPNPDAPFFSDSNSKLLKDGIISFNLPAGHSCPGKGDCFGICYAMQGPQSWPDAMKKRVHNWGMAERPDFVEKVNAELQRWPRKSKKSATGKIGDIVRVHDSGDFYSQEYIDKWHQIAKSNPNKHFYAYTKALDLDWKKLHELPNFTVIQSVGSKHDHLIDPKMPHSYIFPDKASLDAQGYVDTHESDLPAAKAKENPKIGLVVHGIFSGAHDPKAYGESFSEKKVEKSLAKSVGPVLKNLPNAYKFDQLDHVSQLSHSKNPMDRMTLKMLHHHGELQSPSGNGIDDSLESFVGKKISENGSSGSPAQLSRSESSQSAVTKFFASGTKSLKKQDNMAVAASSIRNAFGGGASAAAPITAPAAPAPAAPVSGSLGSRISAGLTGLRRSMLKKDDKPHAPNSPEDKAHDIVEEKEKVSSALSKLMGEKSKSKALAHLRDRNEQGKSWERSSQNQIAGKAPLEKKQGVPEGVSPDKMERCVLQVKKKDVKNPYAVCSASLQKMSMTLRKSKDEWVMAHEELLSELGREPTDEEVNSRYADRLSSKVDHSENGDR